MRLGVAKLRSGGGPLTSGPPWRGEPESLPLAFSLAGGEGDGKGGVRLAVSPVILPVVLRLHSR